MKRSPTAHLPLVYLAFVSIGLPDTVLGIVWPSLRDAFDLPQPLLALPLAVNAGFYFLSGLLAGRLIAAFRIGGLLAWSTLLVALGVLGLAASPAFALFVACGVLVGFGSGAVDAALNTWVASHLAARHMSWLHAAYSLGAALGPALMTGLLARGASWRLGYLAIAAALAALGVAFLRARGSWGAASAAEVVIDSPGGHGPIGVPPDPSFRGTLRNRTVWLQVAIFFLYSGVEVTAGQWSYTLLLESRGLSGAAAGGAVTLYWAGLLAGRILSGFVVERLGPARQLRRATATAVLACVLFALPGLPAAVTTLALAGISFALAPIYPGLMAETPRRIGAAAHHAVGFQVSAATAGIAILPAIAGLLGTALGLDAIGWLVVGEAVLLFALHERLLARTEGGVGRP